MRKFNQPTAKLACAPRRPKIYGQLECLPKKYQLTGYFTMATGISKREAARRRLKMASQQFDSIFVVHYACTDVDHDASKNEVISIAVRDLATRTTYEFFGPTEKELLAAFGDFVTKNPGRIWAHYDMERVEYGFPVLNQRASIHGIPIALPAPESRLDIKGLLHDLYGRDFADHPRLKNLILMNGYRLPPESMKHSPAWASSRVCDLAGLLDLLIEGKLITKATNTKLAAAPRRGRPLSRNAEARARIVAAWKSGRFKTYADLAQELGISANEVGRAVNLAGKKPSSQAPVKTP